MHLTIPKEVQDVVALLRYSGYEAYLVGGCVRDALRGIAPNDWDVATNAEPEQIQGLFSEHVYENRFGTVGVKTGSEDPRLAIVEVTTYRIDGAYLDGRRPETVERTEHLEEDLARRDFTINALAYGDGVLIDHFHGEDDLAQGLIRAVGNPTQRFEEDALRLMRAVRFAAQLGFTIEDETAAAIRALAPTIARVSFERIRDEFTKLVLSEHAVQGIELMREYGLLAVVLPELAEGIGIGQNKHHIYSVYEHNLRTFGYAVEQNYDLVVRLASLFHDIGKPKVKRGNGPDSTFYNHEVVGGRMTKTLMTRLHFSADFVQRVSHLVRHHMFFYNVDEVSPAGVRRFIRRVGPECIDDLFRLREGDRIGSGVPKAVPYKLRHLRYMIDQVKSDPISPAMLKLSGTDIMEQLSLAPGPRIGAFLALLLEEVIEDPTRNDATVLAERVRELHTLDDAALFALATQARERARDEEGARDEELKKQHHVR
jgi:tRNA nucleotidyltransferase (CCA-adding enzyme)